MGYGNLSHTEVIISHEVRENFDILDLLLDKCLIRHSVKRNVTFIRLSSSEDQAAVLLIVNSTAALTLLSDNLSYIPFFFTE